MVVNPKVGLALGSGGLRGLAHVGVLRVFEQEQIPIDYIAGCSIGSLIGALYCAGLDADTIWKLAKDLKRWHWIDFNLPRMGIFSGERVLETLGTLIKHKDFADLTIPLAIVATDLKEGREVVFTRGPVASAVRASVSVPGIFVPFEYDGRFLIDGAVMNPTPVDIVRKMGADIVIGIDLTSPGNFTISSVFDVIIQTIDIMERQLLKYQANDCHILVQPKTGHVSPSSFETIDECVSLGEQAAREIMPGLKQLLASPK